MNKIPSKFGHVPQESLVSIFPAVIAGTVILSMLVISTLLFYPVTSAFIRIFLILYGISGCAYLWLYYWLYNSISKTQIYIWGNVFIVGIALGSAAYFIPEELYYLVYALVFIASLAISIDSTRLPAYSLITIVTVFDFFHFIEKTTPFKEIVIHGGLVITALIAVELIQQLRTLSQKQMNRLEIINEISKQIVSTLETKELLSLLDAELQNVLGADTYYIGIQKDDEIQMELFHDDGEYFNGINVKIEGTLSSWVIKHQKPLFLSDLRKTVQLEGVNLILLGKPKDSLSWMGVPMKASHVNGIMVIASYRPHAFNKSDMELLSNIAQRAALALDNTYHHARALEQARLDSLTHVYNHGYFIQILHEQTQNCHEQNQPLSLIMLDIDYFKQYNDTFGHLQGDEILVNLCNVIREHIKKDDAVGRWGGEEFAISLPNTDSKQALQIANRIRESLASLKIHHNDLTTIPVPTASQGIAVFPDETTDIIKLIDLADQRLYIAKNRGRDQIEPAPTLHENIKTE